MTLLWFILHRSDNTFCHLGTAASSRRILPRGISLLGRSRRCPSPRLRPIPAHPGPAKPRHDGDVTSGPSAPHKSRAPAEAPPAARPRGREAPRLPGEQRSAEQSRRGRAGRQQRRVGEEPEGGGAAERGRATNPPEGTCPPPPPAGRRAPSLPPVLSSSSFSSLALMQNKHAAGKRATRAIGPSLKGVGRQVITSAPIVLGLGK